MLIYSLAHWYLTGKRRHTVLELMDVPTSARARWKASLVLLGSFFAIAMNKIIFPRSSISFAATFTYSCSKYAVNISFFFNIREILHWLTLQIFVITLRLLEVCSRKINTLVHLFGVMSIIESEKITKAHDYYHPIAHKVNNARNVLSPPSLPKILTAMHLHMCSDPCLHACACAGMYNVAHTSLGRSELKNSRMFRYESKIWTENRTYCDNFCLIQLICSRCKWILKKKIDVPEEICQPKKVRHP